MSMQPSVVPPLRKKAYRKSRKRRRRIRTLFFVILCFSCIFIIQAIKNNSAKGEPISEGSSVPHSTDVAKGMSAEEAARKNFVVTIDPGHGYDDPGCDSEYLGNYAEKDINLSISLLIRDKLKKYGFTVMMTRDSDVKPDSLTPNKLGMYIVDDRDRTDFSNSQNSDLFLSIHCNYFEDKDVSGTRLYYYSDHSESIGDIASFLEKGINNMLGIPCIVNANKKNNAYNVCLWSKAPAILAEVGFVTNPEDAKNLIDKTWQKNYAEGLSQGIINYYKEYYNNSNTDTNNAK